mgnify:CR=1 FL=1
MSLRTNDNHKTSAEHEYTVDARVSKHVMDQEAITENMKGAHDSSPQFHALRSSRPINYEDTSRLTRNGKMLIVSESENRSTYKISSRPSQSPMRYTEANNSPTKGKMKKDYSKRGFRASPVKKAQNKENDIIVQLDS